MLDREPAHALSIVEKLQFGARVHYQIDILQTRLPRSTWILQTSYVTMWRSSRMLGVKLEVYQDPGFGNISGKWTCFGVDGTYDPNRDWQGLMIRHHPREWDGCEIRVDGVDMKFSYAPNEMKLGDCGHFTDSKDFFCEGNLFADLKSLSLTANITPRQHNMSERCWYWNNDDSVKRLFCGNGFNKLYKLLGQSLPSNDDLNSLLASLSTRCTNKYLITTVVQCPPDPRQPDSGTTHWYKIVKPFVWHRNEGAGSVVGGGRGETQGDQTKVNDVDEMEL
ncbi:hypothetical protein SCLCIDRAFT_1224464 [Scleroderma citrinum Foug A]|uniref:Uncharacterized protein n=1 Tax=Scleroderma citrinum Foug A TaxID=1036808 RepID=A0A0C3D537_9AGAM|nr:hypothetical protein SCLCIDRAFT_1224464 [Scleroderma citrinum Foug A]